MNLVLFLISSVSVLDIRKSELKSVLKGSADGGWKSALCVSLVRKTFFVLIKRLI